MIKTNLYAKLVAIRRDVTRLRAMDFEDSDLDPLFIKAQIDNALGIIKETIKETLKLGMGYEGAVIFLYNAPLLMDAIDYVGECEGRLKDDCEKIKECIVDLVDELEGNDDE